eukprot:966045-Amorphochlora_amoeboformis.AAC.1
MGLLSWGDVCRFRGRKRGVSYDAEGVVWRDFQGGVKSCACGGEEVLGEERTGNSEGGVEFDGRLVSVSVG